MGNCTAIMAISRLPTSQVLNTRAFQLDSFRSVCENKPVYQIVKTKDLNNCKNPPSWYSAKMNKVHNCDFSQVNCGELIKVMQLKVKISAILTSGFLFVCPFNSTLRCSNTRRAESL